MITKERYDKVAVAFHWITALLIIGMIAVGLYMVTIPPRTPPREFLFNLHKSFGIVVFFVTLARLGWRWKHPPPPWPPETPAWNKTTAQVTHGLLYGALIVQATSGYLMSEFGRFGISFFGIELPRWGSDIPDVRAFFLTLHGIGAFSVIVLTGFHAAAAIHHVVKKSSLRARGMW